VVREGVDAMDRSVFKTPGEIQRAVAAKVEQAVAAMKDKRGEFQDDNCPRCHVQDWNADLVEIPVKSQMTIASIGLAGGYHPTGDSTLPALGLVCQNCGYMIFHNLNILGIPIR
jgi:hypothetical protein